MSGVFVDTSALYALIASNDVRHPTARRLFERLRHELVPLHSSSYVLVETYALVGRRLGAQAVRRLRGDLVPLLRVVWIDAELHERALDLLEQSSTSDVSLVDASSFVIMRSQRLARAFAFDAHFTQAGFELLS